jgi:rhodanese-related sulfurtransferase
METQHGLPTVSCRELRKIKDQGKKHVLIDVRDGAVYEAGHVEDSIHVPMKELETNIDSVVPDKDEYVIVIGEELGLAPETFEKLKSKGYSKVEFLLGGFDEWCKPATPDITDLVEDAEMEKGITENTGEHGEDKDEVEQGSDDEPLM